ncbi:hypothetical protein MTP04_34190 [Lysinibacillus sp. PLM2]|nr:hypothetical protein MTP04_34190 [Lysinibacillus sp. PLM2]
MAIENTKVILEQLVEMSRLLVESSPKSNQEKLLFRYLKHYIPDVPPEELHFILINNGLFTPEEIVDLDITLKRLEDREVWRIVQKEYEKLKNLWNGIETPIFIFPLTKHRPNIDGIIANKNGLSFREIIFLFISLELEDTELKAMVAHEYHHCCRLEYLNKAPGDIPLKDSLIIEGMAECAVEELYGSKWCSPWINRYSLDEMKKIWFESFVPYLNNKGVIKHQPFLYGDGTSSFPRWIGYCIGYSIVKSFLQKNGPINQEILIHIPTDELISRSDFL